MKLRFLCLLLTFFGNKSLVSQDFLKYPVVMISATNANSSAMGSGIIVGSEGDTLFILTAKHVINEYSVNIKFLNNQERPAKMFNSLKGGLDIAVLKCPKPSRFDRLNGSYKVGELPIEGEGGLKVVGHPRGKKWDISHGHFLKKDAPNYIDHKLTLTPGSVTDGNSGGPVLNQKNELIGMVIKMSNKEVIAIKISKVISILNDWDTPLNYLNGSVIGSLPAFIKDPIAGEFVLVEGGSFQMGSKDGRKNEQPVHPVTVKDYFIGKFEVSQAIWKKVMGENPSIFKDCDQCPVESVSWNGIQDFIRKLNQQSNYTYRLPTEAEWEYAARGGSSSKNTTYAGSNDPNEVGWYGSNSGGKIHPVGEKDPNELGLHDMSGNVWEWCEDWYHNSYKGAPADGSAWLDPKDSYRVVRGGSWSSGPAFLRVANRYVYPVYGRSDIGFRLTRTAH